MSDRQELESARAAVDAGAKNVGQRRSSSPRRCKSPAADAPSIASERALAVPSWDDIRNVLFGGGGCRGLLERCRDDATLVAAAARRHPYLAAYCAHVGRDRLALTPIHDEESDRGRTQLDELRDAHENLAPVWRERWLRGLPVAPGERGRSDLRKPDFERVLSAAGVPKPAAAGDGQRETSAPSHGANAGTRDQESS